jgi:hypothetical protein
VGSALLFVRLSEGLLRGRRQVLEVNPHRLLASGADGAGLSAIATGVDDPRNPILKGTHYG